MACLSLPSIAFAPKASNLSLDYLNRSSVCLSQIGFGPIKNSRKVRLSVCGALRNIDADDFRHPLDKQNTLIMRAIPGLNEIVKGVLGTIAERFMVLENMGNSVLVSENQVIWHSLRDFVEEDKISYGISILVISYVDGSSNY